jgi:phenylpyruvate tautomerase PptA (4-oxalocrotonate tautomerase family)
MEREEILTLSQPLLDFLVDLIEVPRDHFTLEFVNTSFIRDGHSDPMAYPFIEVLWFPREEEKKKIIAEHLTTTFKKLGYPTVTVYFTDLDPEQYYENGDHF